MSQTQELVIRRDAMNDSYGLGEVISDGVTLFRAGMYNLTKEELDKKLKQVKKAVIRK